MPNPRFKIAGKVSPGRGLACQHLEPYAVEIGRQLGERPVAGSLNVVLSTPLALDPSAMVIAADNRFFWPITCEGIPSIGYRWRACPLHIIEVVSSRHFRSACGLVDGSRVTIELRREILRPITTKQHLAWFVLWRFRGELFYRSEAYLQAARKYGWRIWPHAVQGPLHRRGKLNRD